MQVLEAAEKRANCVCSQESEKLFACAGMDGGREERRERQREGWAGRQAGRRRNGEAAGEAKL